MAAAILKYTQSNDPFKRYALTRNAIEWWDSVNFSVVALQDNSSKVGKQIAGKVTKAAIASIAGENKYSGHAATDWVVKHEHEGVAPNIDILQKNVRAFYQGVLKGNAQLFLPDDATKKKGGSWLVSSGTSISEDERNANFSVMMRRVVLQPTPNDMKNASGLVAEAAFIMLQKSDEQIGQYNKAIGKLQVVDAFENVVLVNVGPQSDEVERLRNENTKLKNRIKVLETKLHSTERVVTLFYTAADKIIKIVKEDRFNKETIRVLLGLLKKIEKPD